ncbi:alpha/beta hydrolase [soil metagenome]
MRKWLGATFYTSRQQHGDLSLVVKRFPRRDDAPDGPTFVLVHGIGVSSRYFQPLASELARSGRVFLVDLPGYGAAPNPRRAVTIADHAEVLAAFLERTSIENPVLVGHSWGSQVVSTLAIEHPDITDTIVLMAPTLPPTARTFWTAFGHLMHDSLREPPLVFGIAFTDYVLRCGINYLLHQVPYMLADRMERRLGSLRARVLIINGDRDPIVDSTWARQLTQLGGSYEFREVRGPHVIMHTDPVMIAEHIVEFSERSG